MLHILAFLLALFLTNSSVFFDFYVEYIFVLLVSDNLASIIQIALIGLIFLINTFY